MQTRITKLLEIEYPVIQGGMAWVANAALAANVSKAGGIGFIGAANAPAEWVRSEIRRAKEITDKPIGVNVMLLSEHVDEVAQVVVEEGVKAVTTGAGNPAKYMKQWKEAGIRVIPVVASVAMARMMERAGADAIVAEGMESGGHIGEQTTMSLLPQVVDAVSVPVIGAGGIGDGRGMAAALMLGAEAVQLGTRFIVAKESTVSQAYKDRVIGAKDIDSVVTGRTRCDDRYGKPVGKSCKGFIGVSGLYSVMVHTGKKDLACATFLRFFCPRKEFFARFYTSTIEITPPAFLCLFSINGKYTDL